MGDIVQQAQMAGLFDGSLSSCQAELQELMRQIDIMVNNKRLEWEASIKATEAQVRQRDEEIVTIKMALDAKTAETNRLTHELGGMERTQKELVTKYEQQVDQLRREMVALQKSYEKLQRHHGKQNDSVEKVKEESEIKLRKVRVDLRMAESKIEDFESQAHQWDVQRLAYKKQVGGLEEQRKKLAEKCQTYQQDATAYKHQLAKRQQALDQNDLDFRARIVHIEGQLQRAQDTLDGKNSTIQRLEELLEDAGKTKKMVEDENHQLLEDIGRKEHQRQMLESEVSSLQKQLESKEGTLRSFQIETKDQMATLESKIQSREAKLRSHEDESRMRTMQASEETSRLRAQLQDSQRKIQDLIESEARLKMEINRLENRLDDVQGDNVSLNMELTERIDELRRLDNVARQQHQVSLKQKNQLEEGIERHLDAELKGMRHEIESLTGALTQRNAVMDTLRSQLTVTEQRLREEIERKERACSELQMANAELEALRVENRSLQESYIHVQRTIGGQREMAEGQSREGTLGQRVQHPNQEVDENVLQSQLAAVQHQQKMAQSNSLPGQTLTGIAAHDRRRSSPSRSSPRSSPGRIRPGLDQARTRQFIGPQDRTDPGPLSSLTDNYARMYQQNHLASPHRNTLERTDHLKETPDSEMMHSLETGSLESEESPLPSPPTFDSILGHDDKMEEGSSSFEVSSLSDLGFMPKDIRNNRPPSRESVGTRFLREDQKHQAELEQILSAHVQDLEQKTTDALAKHSQRLAHRNIDT
ncbi:centrosomal protein of 63 kDa-like [Lytechinus variegatus]|uniref:centrosomal protein of 63 kDa-like n=1 Tax=Lytechinus variegatus TaxID=7654 RepID=UPI001BB2AD9A|nr:centrosomal protein of 63 kDa-like [Lytechinus variegatus]